MPKLSASTFILLLSGAAILFGTRGKKRARGGVLPRPTSSGASYPAQATAQFNFQPSPQMGSGNWAPGDFCAAPEGQLAARDVDGSCRVFWDYAQDSPILRQHIHAAWEGLGSPDLCEGTPSVLKHPGTHLERWDTNPLIEQIAIDALARTYPSQPRGIWPPSDASYYSARSIWGITVSAVGADLCGWVTVT